MGRKLFLFYLTVPKLRDERESETQGVVLGWKDPRSFCTRTVLINLIVH